MHDTPARRLPPVPAAEWLAALPPATRFAFYGAAAAQAAAAGAWDPAFPGQACRASARATRATLWLGPDEYLLLDLGEPRPAATASRLESALAGIPHALVDISHRQFALQVSGPHAATILSGACPLDLDLGEFPVGMCTRTVLAKADIVLWRTQERAFHLEVWRSFAGYVDGVLREIAAEFHPAPGG
ncbi:MAG: sarcosine oxidase subunit gamma family protein [Steroidobacteraceae bacterium]|jgi:sarcosine oxidase subunit gamma